MATPAAVSASARVAAPERPRPLTAHGRVAPVDYGDVIPRAAAHLVGPAFPRHEPVGPGATAEVIRARAAPDGVAAAPSVQNIVAVTAPDGVAARASPDVVAICAAPDGVATTPTAEAVAAGLALDQVAAAPRLDPVLAPRAIQGLARGGALLAEPAAGDRGGRRGPGQHGLATDRDRDQHGQTGDDCQDQELEHRHHPTRPWHALPPLPCGGRLSDPVLP